MEEARYSVESGDMSIVIHIDPMSLSPALQGGSVASVDLEAMCVKRRLRRRGVGTAVPQPNFTAVYTTKARP